jgi:hypothetical protein
VIGNSVGQFSSKYAYKCETCGHICPKGLNHVCSTAQSVISAPSPDPMNGGGVTSIQAYELLLRQLHRLIADGRGDSPSADAVRDSMDCQGDLLTPDEVQAMSRLSEQLYSERGVFMCNPPLMAPLNGATLEEHECRE